MMQPGGSEIDQHVEMMQPGDNLENSGEPVAPLLIITIGDDIPLLFDQNGCVICLNQFAELEQLLWCPLAVMHSTSSAWKLTWLKGRWRASFAERQSSQIFSFLFFEV